MNTKNRRSSGRASSAGPQQVTEAELRNLWEAAANGVLDAGLFKARKIDPNLCIDGVPLLFVAAEFGHVSVVKALLAHPKIKPNLSMPSGATPLLIGAQNGHVEVVKALLADPRTDVNFATVDEGVTPIFIAAQNGHLDVVRELLAHPGVDSNSPVEGVTPVEIAIEGGFEDIAQCILAHMESAEMA